MVRRYEPDVEFDATRPLAKSTQCVAFLRESEAGRAVLYTDHAALIEENTKALDGTGHATLAEMRAEYDKMREALLVISTMPTDSSCSFHTMSGMLCRAVHLATDAARPKEPT